MQCGIHKESVTAFQKFYIWRPNLQKAKMGHILLTYSNLVQNSHRGIFFREINFLCVLSNSDSSKIREDFYVNTMISRNLSKWSSIVSTMRNLLSPKSFSVKSTNLVIYLVNASLLRNFCLRMHVDGAQCGKVL